MKTQILIGLTALLTGCSTYPKQEYNIRNLKITCDDEDRLNDTFQLYSMNQEPRERVFGFYVKDRVFVRWSGDTDKNGEPLPNFEDLGHEVWHHIKGDYHK